VAVAPRLSDHITSAIGAVAHRPAKHHHAHMISLPSGGYYKHVARPPRWARIAHLDAGAIHEREKREALAGKILEAESE